MRIHRESLSDLEAIEIRELHVEQHDIWPELLGGPDCGSAVPGFAYNIEAFGRKQGASKRSEPVVVVHDQNRLAHLTKRRTDSPSRHRGAPCFVEERPAPGH